MSGLRLFLLGSPRFEREGVPIDFDTRKNLALVAYLAMTGQSHNREVLINLLWPELEPRRGRAGLRRNLSILKKALAGEWLLVDREIIGTDQEANFWLDVDEFHDLIQACQEQGHTESDLCPSCLTTLAKAAELYQGDFLSGFSLRDSSNFDEWQFFQTESLRQEFAQVLEKLVRGFSAKGEYETALPYARRWLALDPLRESIHRHLMQLYARDGQQAAALRQYHECVQILETELGLAPSKRTTSLYEDIRIRSRDRDEYLFHPGQPRHNIPIQLTPFIGRKLLLIEVQQELMRPEVRLLTLTGPGGTGKTRLSLKVASEVLNNFRDGVYFVELAPVHDAALVLPTIAETLDFREFRDRPLFDLLKDHLRNKVVLLVLDNFEQVAEAAPLVSEMLAAAPHLKVMVTSRASLRIYGEHVYSVPPLELPKQDKLLSLKDLEKIEAVRLFLQRAQAMKTDFFISDENGPTIAEICTRLDGLPLAIELAAARVSMLPPQEILIQLNNRLHFLTGGAKDRPARHQALRATLDWSHDLLNEDEKTLFRRLAVFAADFSLEAVEAIADASRKLNILNGLQGLVDQNLLQQSAIDGKPRYAMLETTREYALEQLVESGEADTIHQRHADFFLSLAEKIEPELYGSEQANWLGKLGMEYKNMQAALAWTIENALGNGLRLAGALGRFWHVRAKHREGRDWLAKALAKTEGLGVEIDRFRPKALNQAGILAYFQDDLEMAYSLQEESKSTAEIVGDQRSLAQALCDLGVVVMEQGDILRGRSLIEESLLIFREIGDRSGLGRALQWHGAVTLSGGEYERSRLSAEESIALAQETGDINQLAFSMSTLGGIGLQEGDYGEAQSFFQESLRLFQKADDKVGVAFLLGNVGDALYMQGDYRGARKFYLESLQVLRDIGGNLAIATMRIRLGYVSLRKDHKQQAQAHFLESLDIQNEHGNDRGVLECLVGLSSVAESEEEIERAVRLLGLAETILERSEVQFHTNFSIFQSDYDRIMKSGRDHLDKKAFERAWMKGQTQDLEVALKEMLEGIKK